MSEYFSHTLPNGLRIVHKPHNGAVSYAGFIINVGTRDERDDEHGMAHFIEHMLFKGTKKRSSRQIINRIESVGGELNAFTNKEETVLYSVFLEEHFERAFELMSDMMFNSEFPQSEIDKEVEVIIDEIHSYEDSPSELIYDEFENLIFKYSSLGHNILGSETSLMSFDTGKAKDFIERYYTPENIVFFSMGKTDFAKIVKSAEKILSGVGSDSFVHEREKPMKNQPQKMKVSKDTSQVHVILGAIAYDMYNEKRTALYLMNNILGGPCMSSRLNLSLREKKGYVYNVESSITSYTDTGFLSIYFGTDEKNVEKCLKLVNRELDILRNTQLTSSQLAAAKKQVLGQVGVSNDNNENVALALGKSFLHYNHFDSREEIYEKINKISEAEIKMVVNEILSSDSMFSLIYF
ncbi:pitrilysin family protein [Dysgonomonas sp. 520]|uniref:M16 family metallopeptidase n=1 Tax=Dysgonomonas sp. 520 TaxID=2302931 RepID=UPI0013D0B7FD|nr:pitrilysin family protein [Dysgonomonas sp. 520]NDW11222.1 insulinase family protein [Dysgonomonas sp. 520]